ncbi:MAG TPA: hypothetical protein DEP69_04605, partial [Acidimicrobiaceae bacterium]|nr:hypothetical protein [Acidimicrobiaceae bacterium]
MAAARALSGAGTTATTAVLCGLAAAVAVATVGLRAGLAPVLAFGWGGALLSVIDARTRLLPNRVLCPAAAVGVVLSGAAATVDSASAAGVAARLAGCALGALLGWGLMHLVWRIAGGLGYGDVRLGGYIGLHLGYL